MNKAELVAALAEKTNVTKAAAAENLDAVVDIITGALKSKDEVKLPGFGNFSVTARKATKGRNPATGAEIDIPARNVPKFSPGKALKDAVA
jgi:DNA-binding protein HU-beta